MVELNSGCELVCDGRDGARELFLQESLGHSRLETSQRYITGAQLEETSVNSLPAFGTELPVR